jgi:amino acid permease
MRDASESNMRAVSRNAYLLVLFMDFLIGIIAYVTFTSDVQGNVLLK